MAPLQFYHASSKYTQLYILKEFELRSATHVELLEFPRFKVIDEGYETKSQTSGVEEISTPVYVLGNLIHNL